jgi:putative flavoprotein involved in K+ transport
MEVARHRRVWLAGASTGRLPRRLLGRDVYDWIWPALNAFSVDTRVGRRLRERARRGDPLVGISEGDIAASGVARVGRVTGVRDGMPVCGSDAVRPRTVIWCTGFSPDYRWIDLPVFERGGLPRHSRGVVAGAPGLFFVGLRFQHTMTSALLGGVGRDAAYIAERVSARVTVPAEACSAA